MNRNKQNGNALMITLVKQKTLAFHQNNTRKEKEKEKENE